MENTTEQELVELIPRLLWWVIPPLTLDAYRKVCARDLKLPNRSALAFAVSAAQVPQDLSRALQLWNSHSDTQKLEWLHAYARTFKEMKEQEYRIASTFDRPADDTLTHELAIAPAVLRFLDVVCHAKSPDTFNRYFICNELHRKDLVDTEVSRFARDAWFGVDVDESEIYVDHYVAIIGRLDHVQRYNRKLEWCST